MEANPVMYTDPSGFLAENDWTAAAKIYYDLLATYNVRIKRDWGLVKTQDYNSLGEAAYPSPNLDPTIYTDNCYRWVEGNWQSLRELELVEQAVKDVSNTLGGPNKFKSTFHNRPVDITRKVELEDKAGLAFYFIDIWLNNSTFKSNSQQGEAFSLYTIAHELGHIWDIRENFMLTRGLGLAVGTIQQRCIYFVDPNTCWTNLYYSPSNYLEEAPGDPNRLGNNLETDKYAYYTKYEDWAETFASYVYKSYWSTCRSGFDLIVNGIRWTYVKNQIQNIP